MRYFGKWCKEAFGDACGLSFHSLRHTHATVLLENTADVKYVSTRLGHASIKITLDIYAHVTQKMKNANIQVIENSFYNSLARKIKLPRAKITIR